ncbi:hypothetical protein BGX38DRAFT_719450 [Terfezia claveryi]|nr:hypothetical protein BGX38DRAFT_719450 [Terfezia claveryi]
MCTACGIQEISSWSRLEIPFLYLLLEATMSCLPTMMLYSHLSQVTALHQNAGWDPSTLIQLAPISSLQFSESEDPLLQGICIMRRTNIVPPLPSAPGTEAKEPTPKWKKLRTGAVIRLVTNDSVKYLLPHPDLLSLHAALSRVVRCAAAAGPEMLDLEEDEMNCRMAVWMHKRMTIAFWRNLKFQKRSPTYVYQVVPPDCQTLITLTTYRIIVAPQYHWVVT